MAAPRVPPINTCAIRNQGKSEAVRAGIRTALSRRCTYVGYWDADLATPLDEIPRLIGVLQRRTEREIAFGSRVQLLGRVIERSPVRHYAGRLFATMASLALGLPVYDTQCGAKIFRVTGYSDALFAEPFTSRWLIDIEVIARLIQMHRERGIRGPEDIIVEVPLKEWRDIAGSKVRPSTFVKAAWELLLIRHRYLSAKTSHRGLAASSNKTNPAR
jgi:dolichyl-phosphate beta-glucosyltransferase